MKELNENKLNQYFNNHSQKELIGFLHEKTWESK